MKYLYPAILGLFLLACESSSKPNPNDKQDDSHEGSQDASGQDDAKSDAKENGEEESDASSVCEHLFGRPSENSGLSEDECKPSCNCDGVPFTEPTYTNDNIASLKERLLLTDLSEFFELEDDPYLHPEDFLDPSASDKVCAVIDDEEDPKAYRLETFDSEEAALAIGAKVTHGGACGLCSSLQDLAVYMERRDLTNPVRSCGIQSLSVPRSQVKAFEVDCLKDLGFSESCAEIWYYNLENTKRECQSLCMPLLDAPHHLEDGSLNACIQCDEDQSGPIFKRISGRTRRNSGLSSALCRPCDSVFPVKHF